MLFDSFKQKLESRVFLQDTTVSLPTKYVLGLSTTAPTADGGNITEPPAASGYQRIELNDLVQETTGGVINNTVIDYGTSSAAWGTVSYSVIYDELGTPIMYDQLNPPKTVEAGTILTIKRGGVVLYFGNVDA